jgi:hypothetical protein
MSSYLFSYLSLILFCWKVITVTCIFVFAYKSTETELQVNLLKFDFRRHFLFYISSWLIGDTGRGPIIVKLPVLRKHTRLFGQILEEDNSVMLLCWELNNKIYYTFASLPIPKKSSKDTLEPTTIYINITGGNTDIKSKMRKCTCWKSNLTLTPEQHFKCFPKY